MKKKWYRASLSGFCAILFLLSGLSARALPTNPITQAAAAECPLLYSNEHGDKRRKLDGAQRRDNSLLFGRI